jgi:hypothetical protein
MTVAIEPAKPVRRACAICRAERLSREAADRLTREIAPLEFLDRLIRDRLYDDAAVFLAHWLAAREAVWWGCLCAWWDCRPSPSPAASQAIEAALRWVQEPNEETRRKAEAAGMALGAGDPAGAIALAAFWSGGSMSAPELPDAPAPPGLTAQMVVSALRQIVALGPLDQHDFRWRQLLRIGMEIRQGRQPWEEKNDKPL